ncbi:hypothetical protein V496_00133 [Pseudogymnoascus sp. VKM F-4515 (FW-2607)]|nr:hypothetical protein V496_00133 [Pseudogymnoascus sp. VKM F-4515 (FW-2607)]
MLMLRTLYLLGTLVTDPRKPIQDALTTIEAKEDVDFTVRDQQGVEDSLDLANSTTFAAQITKLFNISRSKSTSNTLDVSAKAGYIYELRSPKPFFRLACAEPKVRKWLEEGFQQNDKSYFVVGLRTFLDATVSESNRDESTTKAEAAVPVGEIVKANTAVSLGDAADVKFSGQRSRARGSRAAFNTEGERIFAVCYNRVKMSRGSECHAVLGRENVWRFFTDQRKSGASVEEEWYEADLDDVASAEDSKPDLTARAKLVLDSEDVQYYLDEST